MFQEIAPHIYHNEFKHPVPRGGDPVMVFSAGQVLLRPEKDAFPTVAELGALGVEETALNYLFSIDETAYFLLRQAPDGLRGPLRPQSTSVFRRMRPRELAFAGVTALHLANWYRAGRFCGCCGAETALDDKERALRCPKCGSIVYPRINPAVLAAVRHGDRLLLTAYADRPMVSRYALVAGFVEIGETLEDTVRREVMEEVGLRIRGVRYHASQPWGFAGNLMVGFWADLDGDDAVSLDRNELSEAVWLRREEIPESVDPPDLTHTMIELFRRGLDPR